MSRAIFSRQNFPLYFLAASVGLVSLAAYWITRETAPAAESTAVRKAVPPPADDQSLHKFSLSGFDEQGKKFWTLEGESARINQGQTIFLDENATLALRDDTVIRTDRVRWDQESGTLRTEAPVVVDHRSARITGTGANGRLRDHFLQLERDIEMWINETTRLSCAGPMKLYYKESRISFYRKVVVVDPRGTIRANRMDVRFDPETKKVTEITALGNVEIERGEDRTRSHRAIYSVLTGSVRLEGNPRITLHEKGNRVLDGLIGN